MQYRQRPRNTCNFFDFFLKQLLLHSDQVYVACLCISLKILQSGKNIQSHVTLICHNMKILQDDTVLLGMTFCTSFYRVWELSQKTELTSFISHHDYVLSFIRHFLWSWLTICRRSCKGKVPHRRNRT